MKEYGEEGEKGRFRREQMRQANSSIHIRVSEGDKYMGLEGGSLQHMKVAKKETFDLKQHFAGGKFSRDATSKQGQRFEKV